MSSLVKTAITLLLLMEAKAYRIGCWELRNPFCYVLSGHTYHAFRSSIQYTVIIILCFALPPKLCKSIANVWSYVAFLLCGVHFYLQLACSKAQ